MSPAAADAPAACATSSPPPSAATTPVDLAADVEHLLATRPHLSRKGATAVAAYNRDYARKPECFFLHPPSTTCPASETLTVSTASPSAPRPLPALLMVDNCCQFMCVTRKYCDAQSLPYSLDAPALAQVSGDAAALGFLEEALLFSFKPGTPYETSILAGGRYGPVYVVASPNAQWDILLGNLIQVPVGVSVCPVRMRLTYFPFLQTRGDFNFTAHFPVSYGPPCAPFDSPPVAHTTRLPAPVPDDALAEPAPVPDDALAEPAPVPDVALAEPAPVPDVALAEPALVPAPVLRSPAPVLSPDILQLLERAHAAFQLHGPEGVEAVLPPALLEVLASPDLMLRLPLLPPLDADLTSLLATAPVLLPDPVAAPPPPPPPPPAPPAPPPPPPPQPLPYQAPPVVAAAFTTPPPPNFPPDPQALYSSQVEPYAFYFLHKYRPSIRLLEYVEADANLEEIVDGEHDELLGFFWRHTPQAWRRWARNRPRIEAQRAANRARLPEGPLRNASILLNGSYRELQLALEIGSAHPLDPYVAEKVGSYVMTLANNRAVLYSLARRADVPPENLLPPSIDWLDSPFSLPSFLGPPPTHDPDNPGPHPFCLFPGDQADAFREMHIICRS